MEEALLVGGALVLGFGAGVAALLVVRSAKPAQAEPVVELEVIMDDESPVTFVPPAPQAAPAPAAAPSAPAPPPPSPRSHPERQPAMILTRGVQMEDAAYQRPPPPRQAPAPPQQPRPQPWARPAPREEPAAPIQSEWARRLVGPLEPGRAKGVCSGCGTALSVSLTRPLKIACPVCGRTRLLA